MMNQKHLMLTLLMNEFLTKKFKLSDFFYFFISSSFMNLSKPETDIFRLDLDTTPVKPKKSIYINDQPMFVNIAEGLEKKGICYSDFDLTVVKLKDFGLTFIPAVYG